MIDPNNIWYRQIEVFKQQARTLHLLKYIYAKLELKGNKINPQEKNQAC